MMEIADPGGRGSLALQGWQCEASDALPVDSAPAGEAGATCRIAYFTNVYPKISHSFIRTEIAALERRGFAVHRFTIRRSGERFEDAEDRGEDDRTTALLENPRALAGAVRASLITRPRAALAALRLSLCMTGRKQGLRALAYFAEAALLVRLLEREDVRHIHVHFGTNPAAVARLVARLAQVSYSFTVHGPDEFDDPRGLDLAGKIAEARFVVAVSSFGRGQLMRWASPDDWHRIRVVRCAVAPQFVRAAARPCAVVQAPRLLCVARLSAQKGLPLLIEAMAKVAAQRAVTLDLIGDGEDRTAIERQIAQAGLQENVRLLGWQTGEAIREALGEVRALILPSFAEGLPVVLMEAMACERPVIATAIAGVPELVDGEVGWLVPSGSANALAEAMISALDAQPEELAAMGRRGRARVLERHDPDQNAAQLAALLSS
nr:glycosyltransferase [Novosphingobium panipatense]